MDRKIKKATGIVGVAAAVYIVLKYVLVYVAPFLVAFLIVRLLNPAAVKMQEYRPCLFQKRTQQMWKNFLLKLQKDWKSFRLRQWKKS